MAAGGGAAAADGGRAGPRPREQAAERWRGMAHREYMASRLEVKPVEKKTCSSCIATYQRSRSNIALKACIGRYTLLRQSGNTLLCSVLYGRGDRGEVGHYFKIDFENSYKIGGRY